MTNSADPDQPTDLDLQFAKTGRVVFSKRRVNSIDCAVKFEINLKKKKKKKKKKNTRSSPIKYVYFELVCGLCNKTRSP